MKNIFFCSGGNTSLYFKMILHILRINKQLMRIGMVIYVN